MKKFFAVVLFGVCLLGLLYLRGLRIVQQSMPSDTLIVFFQKDCPHCHTAMTFINETVRPKYPDLKIEFLDVEKQENSDIQVVFCERISRLSAFCANFRSGKKAGI